MFSKLFFLSFLLISGRACYAMMAVMVEVSIGGPVIGGIPVIFIPESHEELDSLQLISYGLLTEVTITMGENSYTGYRLENPGEQPAPTVQNTFNPSMNAYGYMPVSTPVTSMPMLAHGAATAYSYSERVKTNVCHHDLYGQCATVPCNFIHLRINQKEFVQYQQTFKKNLDGRDQYRVCRYKKPHNFRSCCFLHLPD